jgi:hypothetical protein
MVFMEVRTFPNWSLLHLRRWSLLDLIFSATWNTEVPEKVSLHAARIVSSQLGSIVHISLKRKEFFPWSVHLDRRIKLEREWSVVRENCLHVLDLTIREPLKPIWFGQASVLTFQNFGCPIAFVPPREWRTIKAQVHKTTVINQLAEHDHLGFRPGQPTPLLITT